MADTQIINLYPHRSLSPKGLRIVLGAVILGNVIVALMFWTLKAWPVFIFMGLDIALVYWAFKANNKAAAIHETITINGEEWILEHADAKGKTSRTFNRRWMRMELEYDEARELIGRLFFISHGKRSEVGSFLGAEERQALARKLSRI